MKPLLEAIILSLCCIGLLYLIDWLLVEFWCSVADKHNCHGKKMEPWTDHDIGGGDKPFSPDCDCHICHERRMNKFKS